jgi:hypothetical protein
MNKTEKLAIAAVVLYAVSQAVNSLRLFEMSLVDKFDWTFRQLAFLSVPVLVFTLLFHIGISVWLYQVSKKEGTTPWVWALFGLVFGILGAILFFAVRIYELLQRRTITANKALKRDAAKGRRAP